MASVYPEEFFRTDKPHRRAGYCFVLMPFEPGLTDVFETIKKALADPRWNFDCQRADDFFQGGHILSGVLRGIGEAEIVLADLTGRNPNVFYELGIAHMVKPPTEIILITQDMDSIPFDLRGFRCISYRQGKEGAKKLKHDLLNTLAEVTKPVYRFSIQALSEYQFPHKLPGNERCLYDFTVFADYLGVRFAKYTLRVRKFIAGQPHAEELPVRGDGIAAAELRPIPCLPWSLRLDGSDEHAAEFSVVYSPAEERSATA